MYLPQEAHKSFTVPFTVISGVVSRPAADAVEKDSQTADRFTISWFSEKQKGLDSSVFTFRENH